MNTTNFSDETILSKIKQFNILNAIADIKLLFRWMYDKLLSNESALDNFIPLTGTEEGKPIANELLMKNTDLSNSSVKLFFDGLEWITETGNELIADYTAITKTNGGFLIDANYQEEEEGDNLAFGLAGKGNFSEIDPSNKQIYAQRQYVDNKVPDLPTETGTFLLKVIDGVPSWVEEV